MTNSMHRSRDPEHAPHTMQVDNETPMLPPILHPAWSNLHKRRMSISPEKFNKGHFEPLAIRTDLPLPIREPPAKRSRNDGPEKKIEIYYDSVGTPKIRETPAKLNMGSMPTSGITLDNNIGDTARSIVPSGHAMAISRLLNRSPIDSTPKSTQENQQKNPFSLLDAFTKHDALCLLLVSYLPMPALIDLYAISKFFHWKFNKEATAFIMASVRTWSPKADQIFPWRCYKPLLIKDPIKRQKASAVTGRGGADVDADYEQLASGSRDVPSLRWLQMVVYRDIVVTDMIISLASRALRADRRTADAVKRMWFIMDLHLNAHRVAVIRSKTYISDKNLEHATEFFLKIDMALTDPGFRLLPYQTPVPNTAFVGSTLRQTLIAERSLTPLWRVLKGWAWHPNIPPKPLQVSDIFELYWRHQGKVPRDIPPEHAMSFVTGAMHTSRAIAGHERVYSPLDDDSLTEEQAIEALNKLPETQRRYVPQPLLTPVDLIMREGVRRQLNQHRWWYRLMLSSWIRQFTKSKTRTRAKTEKDLYAMWSKDLTIAQRKKVEKANKADEERAEMKMKQEKDQKDAKDMEAWAGLLSAKGEMDDKKRKQTQSKDDVVENIVAGGEPEQDDGDRGLPLGTPSILGNPDQQMN